METAEATTVSFKQQIKTEVLPSRRRYQWGSTGGVSYEQQQQQQQQQQQHQQGSPSGCLLGGRRRQDEGGWWGDSSGENHLQQQQQQQQQQHEEELLYSRRSLHSPYIAAKETACDRFRWLCLRQKGVVFENNILSVSCLVGTSSYSTTRTLYASIELSFVAKQGALAAAAAATGSGSGSAAAAAAPTGFHSIRSRVEARDKEALLCSLSPIVRAPGETAKSCPRAIQTVVISVMKPFLSPPELLLDVSLYSGEEQQIIFALPLVLPHFMRPLQLSPAAALQLWLHESMHARLSSIKLSPSVSSAGLAFIEEVISLGGKFAVIKGIKHRLAANSIFAAAELSAIGDLPADCKAVVRYTAAATSGVSAAAKIQVKAQDPTVAASIYELLIYLLEGFE